MRNDHTRRRGSQRNILINCTSELSKKRPHVHIYIYIYVSYPGYGWGGWGGGAEVRRRAKGGREEGREDLKACISFRKPIVLSKKACISLVQPKKHIIPNQKNLPKQ